MTSSSPSLCGQHLPNLVLYSHVESSFVYVDHEMIVVPLDVRSVAGERVGHAVKLSAFRLNPEDDAVPDPLPPHVLAMCLDAARRFFGRTVDIDVAHPWRGSWRMFSSALDVPLPPWFPEDVLTYTYDPTLGRPAVIFAVLQPKA